MEIERKFLLDGYPDNLPLIKEVDCMQGYLSVQPEVRIRSFRSGEYEDYKLTIKSNGDLSREEVEYMISKDEFDIFVGMINQPLIHKEHRKYRLPDGKIFEVGLVDPGADTSFYYAEVEFETVQDALSFKPLDCITEEVTYDSSYKMKNYWTRTRLNKEM